MTKTLDTTGVVLVVLAAIGWILIVINLLNVAGNRATGDATMGKALSTFATLGFVAMTWVVMGVLLLRAGSQELLAGWVPVAAFVVYFLSGAAAIASVFLLDDPTRTWPAAVPILSPLLIIGYIVCVYRPALHPAMMNPAIGGVVWAAVLLLSLAPWPTVFRVQEQKEQGREEAEKVYQQQAAELTKKQHEESLSKIAQMKPDSHLWDWFSLLDAQSGVQSEAIAAFAKNPNRQADLEYALGESFTAMECIPALNVEATPKLCSEAGKWCKKFAGLMPPQNGQPSYYEEKKLLGPRAIQGLAWFRAHGCPLEEGISGIEAGVRMYKDTPYRQQLLVQLQELRSAAH